MKIAPSVINHSLPFNALSSTSVPAPVKQNTSRSIDTNLDARKNSVSTLEERTLLASKTILTKDRIEKHAFGGWFKKKPSRQESGSSSANSENSSVISDSTELPMFILNHVPYVSQGNERMGCWYACARMVGHYVEAGPRLGLPELYEEGSGHSGIQDFSEFDRFIRNEGLTRVDLPDSKNFALQELGSLLYRHGPIIFGWKTPNDSWHMSVMIGVDNDTPSIIFHDPKRGANLVMPLHYFNQQLAWHVPHAMLYR